jgi:hypothetical protein
MLQPAGLIWLNPSPRPSPRLGGEREWAGTCGDVIAISATRRAISSLSSPKGGEGGVRRSKFLKSRLWFGRNTGRRFLTEVVNEVAAGGFDMVEPLTPALSPFGRGEGEDATVLRASWRRRRRKERNFLAKDGRCRPAGAGLPRRSNAKAGEFLVCVSTKMSRLRRRENYSNDLRSNIQR